MSDTALYRKYRPHTFDEVLGQEQLVKALKGAIEQGKIGHAYLFAGSRGIGKTTLARIFAHEIGTKDRDLIEIDAASNRGIDDVRALREEVYTMPFESPYKVYVIDEVHMLTKEAFNALLKTLEEPPRHVVFILATTEADKLPETIVSRCQTFILKRPNEATLREMIMRVAKAEGYVLESASADLIALLADGAFRDAHGILQKVIGSSTDKKISAEEVEEITGSPKTTLLLGLLDAVAIRDLDKSLVAVRALADAGNATKTVLTMLSRLVRAVLLVRSSPSLMPTLKEEYTENEWMNIERYAKESQVSINSKFLTALLDAQMRTGTTYTPELPLELALIEHLTKNP
ncbi:MAG: DNA polymerase III subunit gamma/tau [Candidatus Pacebacteria bacterium]|nr:DNA polymerase III subunit gamma/tau [Candidatus Paceibacterota bacterium]